VTRPVGDLTAHRLHRLVAQEQVRARMPSLVAGVVRDGALMWSGSHGEYTGGPAPSTDLQYRIGSITKTMTGVSVMQLRDEGLLDLGDRLEQHLPGARYGDATIRSLMSHSAGLPSEPPGTWWERSPGVAFDDLAAAVADSPAPLPPGHQFHYSNLAWALLGEVVARLRGGSWWEQLEHRVLRPLGMGRTSYLPQPPAATGYSVTPFADTLTEEPATDTAAMAPAGQVWSTIDDLSRYVAFLLGGADDVLARSTLEEMAIPQSGSQATGLAVGHGLGMQLVSAGSGTLVGHGGSMPGFLAGLYVDRVRQTGAMTLANGTSSMRNLPVALLETLEELEPASPPAWVPVDSVSDPVAEVLGVWHWGNTGFTFGYTGGEIVVAALRGGAVAYKFRLREDGTFVGTEGYHLGEVLHVVRDPDGGISHLECATFVYTRTPYDPHAPIPGGS